MENGRKGQQREKGDKRANENAQSGPSYMAWMLIRRLSPRYRPTINGRAQTERLQTTHHWSCYYRENNNFAISTSSLPLSSFALRSHQRCQVETFIVPHPSRTHPLTKQRWSWLRSLRNGWDTSIVPFFFAYWNYSIDPCLHPVSGLIPKCGDDLQRTQKVHDPCLQNQIRAWASAFYPNH